MTDLPPGFVIDQGAAPAVPQGFVPDGQPAEKKSFGLGDTWPARLAKSIYSAVTLPGDVAQGNVSMYGADGRTNTDVIGRSAELAAVASPVPAATRAGAGIFGVPISPRAVPVVPTREALEQASTSGYDQARGLGVEVRPQPISDLGMRVGSQLNEMGVQSELAPKTFSILGKLADPPAESVATLGNIEALRRSLGHAAKDFANPTEQLAAKTAQRAIDDYLAALPAQDVVRGPAAEASKILSQARGNSAAAFRSERITDDVLYAANLNAGSTYSGKNLGNATRQRIKSLLLSDKKSAGYSADEIAQMEQIVQGTGLGNASRTAGNLLGGGGGLGGMVSAAIGGAATAPYGGVGAAAPLVGMALKKLSDRSVDSQVRILDELIRSRSPLAQELTAANMAVPQEVAPQTAAIVRLLLEGQTQQ